MLTEDPHGIVPVGFKYRHEYEVMGFCEPCRTAVMELMVCIKYPNYVPNDWGYSTTRDYLNVLQSYLSVTSPEDLRAAQHAWRRKQLAKFAAENPGFEWCDNEDK
jgi:hypothetical protein